MNFQVRINKAKAIVGNTNSGDWTLSQIAELNSVLRVHQDDEDQQSQLDTLRAHIVEECAGFMCDKYGRWEDGNLESRDDDFNIENLLQVAQTWVLNMIENRLKEGVVYGLSSFSNSELMDIEKTIRSLVDECFIECTDVEEDSRITKVSINYKEFFIFSEEDTDYRCWDDLDKAISEIKEMDLIAKED